MRLPRLKNKEATYQNQVIEFKGYNANPVIAEGEMSDCKNLSLNAFPCLTPRPLRSVFEQGFLSPTALFAKGKFAHVDGTNFYYDGEIKGLVKEGKKQITSIGDKIIIFPDKTYYDISDDVYGTLENTYTSGTSEITFTASTITTTGDDFDFRAGDAVKITGCTVEAGNNTTAVIQSVAAKVLTFLENTFSASSETAAITLKREVPDMDFICEYNNRLWGCKDSDIYGSKLGDPFNFNVFQGLASDSYQVPVGSDGKFTGCVGYPTHLVFLKENHIHKLFGSKPSNYQLVSSQCQGVQTGCEKSIVMLNDMLIFKSRLGIMAYLGNIPEIISKNFGRRSFEDAVAGTDGERYYVSLNNGSSWELFVYDINKAVWLKEDETQVIDFAFLDGVLYYLDGDDGKVYKCNDSDSDEIVEWMVQFGEMNETHNEKKKYTKFMLNMELESDSQASISINCDRTGWREIYRMNFDTRKTVNIPIIPTRCDIFDLKIEGKGWFKIYSLTRSVQLGSEV